jgi:RecG-like helicase
VAVLTDRLDYVLGKKAAGQLEEHFGLVTVNDLLRHYPRKYSDGMKASTSRSSTSSQKRKPGGPTARRSVSTSSSRLVTGGRR